ncbi:MAG: ABC transporter substrate-binding protein [Candidatus Rokubacteria bacterium]|nr:ABC transporter substrate-binding protein [Candidatus Rokubacteria bacterium]
MRTLTTLLAAVLTFLTTAGAAVAQGKAGGTLVLSYHPEPVTLTTIGTTAVPTALVASKIFESLLAYEWGMKPVPSLAESWLVSADGLAWTFRLRRGVRFHDGKPMTSADVKFSVEQVIRPLHARGRTNFRDLKSIETPDDHTVVFHLGAPQAFFLSVFQPTEVPILPKHLLEKAADFKKSPFNNAPVGTGPFKLTEWARGSHLVLSKNPDYWKPGRPYLDRLVYKVIPDGGARVAALETGEVDLAPAGAVPEPEIGRLAKLPHLTTSDRGYEALGPIVWLELNLRDKILGDVRVRRALAHAIDRGVVANTIWFGVGKPATGPISSGQPFYHAGVTAYPYDPARAERLLDEAGYRRGAGGVRFELTQDFLPYGENWVRLAEYLKQQLGKVGIRVTTRASDLSGWLRRIYTDWDFQLTSTFSNNYADPAIGVERTYISGNIKKGVPFTNSMNYVNPEVDALFAQAGREMNPAARAQLYRRVQELLVNDLPVIWLMEMPTVSVVNRRVQDLFVGPISMYSSFDQVWLAK